MVVFPNAKINIGLKIVEKRSDGFHNLQSCFYPVPWYDILEVVESDKFSFTTSGIEIPGERNICIKAHELVNEDYSLPHLNIHLHKNIPIGAGLGGGSADGAFMLKLLNVKFSLAIGRKQLLSYASRLGSDCPFFIDNTPTYVEGTGNILTPINLNLQGYYITIIYPQVHINSKQAFSGIKPMKPVSNLKELLEAKDPGLWKTKVTNDFEVNATRSSLQLKDMLYEKGVLYASMSGSGSAVYGISREPLDIKTEHTIITARIKY